MNTQIFTIKKNEMLQPDIFRMVLSGDCRQISAPGQFVNIRLEGFYLRRPISICDWTEDSMTLVYKTVGHGTEALSTLPEGTGLDVLMPLGNGFTLRKDIPAPVLVGGGIGLPPIYGLARALVKEGLSPKVICGFNTEKEVILTEEFRSLGIDPVITTVDGSVGIRGMVTDALAEDALGNVPYLYACGPEPMLKALYGICADGQFSFEARMACGFGACMGCSCRTISGYKRICKDGPVLEKEEILW